MITEFIRTLLVVALYLSPIIVGVILYYTYRFLKKKTLLWYNKKRIEHDYDVIFVEREIVDGDIKETYIDRSGNIKIFINHKQVSF